MLHFIFVETGENVKQMQIANVRSLILSKSDAAHNARSVAQLQCQVLNKRQGTIIIIRNLKPIPENVPVADDLTRIASETFRL